MCGLKFCVPGLLLVSLSMAVSTATAGSESVCDPLKAEGVTKGLYGMCVSFCEGGEYASHEAPLTEDELQALAEKAPSGAILRNYNRMKQASDPDMPCIVSAEDDPCPCWSPGELREVSDGVSPDHVAIDYGCNATATSIQVFEGQPGESYAALSTNRSRLRSCFYNNSATAQERVMNLETEDQAAGCMSQITARCNEIQ